MHIIQFQCDKCKQTWTVGEKDCPQQVNLSLTLNFGNNHPPEGYIYGTTIRHQTWCRPCIVKFVPWPEPEAVKQAPTYDPSQMLVEALEQLGFTRNQ